MSYQEKKTIISLVTSFMLIAAYCLYAFGKAGMEHLNDLQFWAKTILIFIGIGIVALIIIQIVFHILLAISKAVQQKMRDEAIDDKEFERAFEREIVEDEMDKLIELKANKIGYSIIRNRIWCIGRCAFKHSLSLHMVGQFYRGIDASPILSQGNSLTARRL